MTPLRALLVDDEPLALRRLSVALAEIAGVEVIETTTSARTAPDLIQRLQPDIVFLDIAMPGLDGFEVIRQLPGSPRPAIVFVTAYATHAVQAFDIDAVDYLLKPVAPDRLATAVERARAWIAGREGLARDVAAADRALLTLAGEDSLWTHRHQEFVRVPIDQIAWLEAEGDYVRIHADNGGGLVRTTLSALEARLDPDHFIRVHRSAICRRSAITGLRRKATGALSVSLANGDRAPVGRTYSSGLRALLKRIQHASGAGPKDE